MISTAKFITIFLAPLAVLACEGECISGTTEEYLKLYSTPVHQVLQNMADKIATRCVPTNSRRPDSMSYMIPVLNAFNEASFNELEHAIFPRYFHGKCLYANGTVPDGCPNPDCPVVCGTPGSMVHFFPVLTRLVFDSVSAQLASSTSPGSKTYKQVESLVLADTQKTRRNALSRMPRSAKLQRRVASTAEKCLRGIMKESSTMMLKACGGQALSMCNWGTHMKKFILQYP